MHHKTHEKYVKMKEAGMTAEELKTDMVANGVAEVEADKFIAEVFTPAPPATGTDTVILPNPAGGEQQVIAVTDNSAAAVVAAATAVITPVAPAPSVAPAFNYKNLTGDEWKRYQDHVKALPLFDMLDFEQYKAEEVKEERYPGMPGSPWDVVGIRIINDTPINKTRINIQTANELNRQLANSKRIYLLKR